MDKPASSDMIYRNLLDRIISLDLEPGCKISENKIAEEYNVSRSVVRNSIARLTQIGFLTVYPQRGTYVTLIDLDYIKTALLIRIAIEKEMLYRFMKEDNKSEVVEKMKENIAKQEKYCDAKEYMLEFKRLDEEFHEYIMLSVETDNILSLINEHLLHISRWRNLYIKSGYKISMLVEEHKQILKYIAEDNLEKALDSMSNHIDTISFVANANDSFIQYIKK